MSAQPFNATTFLGILDDLMDRSEAMKNLALGALEELESRVWIHEHRRSLTAQRIRKAIEELRCPFCERGALDCSNFECIDGRGA